MDILSIKIYMEGERSMKTKLMKRSLCIALVVVMILGLAVINAGACSCSSQYWILEYDEEYEYYQLNADEHDVVKKDIAYCMLCYDTWVHCTNWYSESHSIVTYCLGYVESIQKYEYEDYCPLCGYGKIYYLPY